LGVLLLAHPAYDALHLYKDSAQAQANPYQPSDRRLADRVVLIIVDSWAQRIVETDAYMPKLRQRMLHGASGILWAPLQTGTMQGIFSLATGSPPGGLAAIGLISSTRFNGWTIFDDVKRRGEKVTFAGGPAWAALFGDRGTDNFPEGGHGPDYRGYDVSALENLKQELLSKTPPTLSVMHISETDFAAHQFGTTSPAYMEVMRFWDGELDHFLGSILTPGTTVIVTADHGNDLNGAHGGSGDIYRRVPVLMWGAAVTPGARFEMNATDMPATIAVLLGIRAPKNVAALPAVEALSLSTHDKNRILRTAYLETVLSNPVIQGNQELLARAPRQVTEGGKDGAGASVPGDSNEDAVRLRRYVNSLAPELAATRTFNLVDAVFIAIALAATLHFFSLSLGPNVAATSRTSSDGILWCTVFALAEAVVIARSAYGGAIKNTLQQHSPIALLIGFCVVVLGAATVWQILRHRQWVNRTISRELQLYVAAAYLLITGLHLTSAIGLLVITFVIGATRRREWPDRLTLTVVAMSFAYEAIGYVYLWPTLGENLSNRYRIGGPIAIGATAWLLLTDYRHGSGPFGRRSLDLIGVGILLALLPAGGVGVMGWTPGREVPLIATLLQLALTATVFAVRRTSVYALISPAILIVYWLKQSAVFFDVSLLAVGALAIIHLLRATKEPAEEGAATLSVTSLLLLLTPPDKSISVMIVLFGLLIFKSWKTVRGFGGEIWTAIVLALLAVATRYVIFDFLGSCDDMVNFSLVNIDLRSPFVGNSSRNVGAAAAVGVLSLLAAGWAVLVILRGLCSRLEYLRAAAFAATLIALNILQASVYSASAIGVRSRLYEGGAFSVFVNTAIFLLFACSFGTLWMLRERSAHHE
jgi:hypothetical protein